MLRGHATQAPYDRSLEVSRYALLEGSEPVFEEGPAGLDGTEIRRVRRKKEQASARVLHQGTDFGRVVGAKVVEHDNVARIQSWDEPTANEVDELRPVDGAVEGLVSQDAVGTYGPDNADVLSPVGWLVIDDALTTRRPTVGRRHGDIAARLVDEDQSVRRDVLDPFKVVDALCLDVAAELFRRAETLFFRVTPARWRERNMLERLRCTPCRALHSSFSWSRVAFGISATSRSNSGNWSSEILGGNPPPAGSGTTWPSSRWRRRSLETVASPTPKRCANSKYVPSLRSYAATIRRLRSNDSEFTTSYRSDPPDLFKREPV
jgi:hypothetical protein